jgi:hypothetical protein
VLLTSLLNDFTDEMHNLNVALLDAPGIVGWDDNVVVGKTECGSATFAKQGNGGQPLSLGNL